MSEVLQCPYCELKFGSTSDMNQHIAFDHPGQSGDEDEAES